MTVHDYDPKLGMALQGDISIVPVPEGITLDTSDEIKPENGQLIIMEGEASGHFHAIDLMERPETIDVPRSKAADSVMSDALAGKIAVPTAKMYRDPSVPSEMVRRGILTRSDLAIAVLVVETGPMCLSHEEHDGIRLPVGRYVLGRQVESVGAETRRVVD